jgi:hypothetical protein
MGCQPASEDRPSDDGGGQRWCSVAMRYCDTRQANVTIVVMIPSFSMGGGGGHEFWTELKR